MGAVWGAIVQLAGGEMDPHLASMKGEYWNVHSMLTSGMDPNERSEEDGGTMLMMCGIRGGKKGCRIATMLIKDFNCNVNARSPITRETAVHVAAYHGKADVLEVLLRDGPSLHRSSLHRTRMLIAASTSIRYGRRRQPEPV